MILWLEIIENIYAGTKNDFLKISCIVSGETYIK